MCISVRDLSCVFSGSIIVLYESVKLFFGCKGYVIDKYRN